MVFSMKDPDLLIRCTLYVRRLSTEEVFAVELQCISSIIDPDS